jgi:PAS domain S-box-containing protein
MKDKQKKKPLTRKRGRIASPSSSKQKVDARKLVSALRSKRIVSPRELEALFHETFDLITLGIGHLASRGRWIRANETLCEIVGYSRKELLARSLLDITHPEDIADVQNSLQQVLLDGTQARSLEIRAVRKDGFPVWISLTLSPVRYAAGRFRHFAVVIEEIGSRRRMEDGLRLFRTAVQSLPLGITISDLDGKIIFMNAAEAKMHGYTVDELLGRDVRLLAPPMQPNGPTLRELMARNLIGSSAFTRDAENIRRDGTLFPVCISSVPVRDMRGTPLGLVSVSEDITDRRNMIEALQESEQKYRNLFESANDAIFVSDVETGILTDCNVKACELVGATREEIIGMHQSRLHPAEQEAEYRRRFSEVNEKQRTGISADNVVCRKDGKLVWVDISSNVFESGGRKFVMGVFRDVTQRKLADERQVQWVNQLRESEARFRELADLLPQPVFETNVHGVLRFVNRSALERFGYVPEDLADGLHALHMIAPDDRERALDVIQGMIKGERTGANEYQAISKDGTTFPVIITSSLVTRDGRPAGLRGIITDITDRKRTEEEVRRSRERLQLLIDRMPLGFIFWNQEFSVELWNPAAETIFGYTAHEAIGKHAEDLIVPPEARDHVAGVWKRLLKGDTTAHSQNENVTRDGRKIFCSWYNTPLRSADGTVTGALSMVQDITERRKIENAISQAKQDWENTFDTITDMITIHDENFNIIRSNKAAAQILGLSWLEIGKAKCYQMYHGTDCPPANCPSCRSLVSGEPSVHEMFEPHLDRHLEIRAIPRIEPGGKMVGLIHVVRDISDRKRAEEEKARLEARLREAQKMEVIGSLAGGVAHEVRNPLNAIMALTDALDQEVGGNPEYKAFMMHMRTQVDRLTALMNDLLELGKPVEQSKLRTESLTEIVAISVDAWKQSKHGKGREVVVSVAGSAEGTYILADAKKLQQVFINLFDNAAQHSPEGSPVRIEVPPPAGGKAEVRVVDQGAGIPADILPRVFDTFFTTRRGGTGLGLSIVKHIVEKHGGTISLDNNDPPPGCTVSVVLSTLEDIR